MDEHTRAHAQRRLGLLVLVAGLALIGISLLVASLREPTPDEGASVAPDRHALAATDPEGVRRAVALAVMTALVLIVTFVMCVALLIRWRHRSNGDLWSNGGLSGRRQPTAMPDVWKLSAERTRTPTAEELSNEPPNGS